MAAKGRGVRARPGAGSRAARHENREAAEIPVIGIGAGPGCDGQVLVLHDLLGLTESFQARFVKRYATLSDEVRSVVRQYAAEVRDGSFPAAEHSFSD